jgi:hypothetical protein
MDRVGGNEEEEGRGKGSRWISGDCILPTGPLFFLYVYLGTYVLIRRDEKNTHSAASGLQGGAWYFIAAFNLTFFLIITKILHKIPGSVILPNYSIPNFAKMLNLESIPAFEWR